MSALRRVLNDERRDNERRLMNCRQNPPDDPGPPDGMWNAGRGGPSDRVDSVAALRTSPPAADNAGWED